MAIKIKGGGKAILIVLALVLMFFGVRYYQSNFVQDVANQTQLIDKIDLPDAPKNAQATVSAVELPSDQLATLTSKPTKVEVMAWNSQMGFIYSNGGPLTTKGSFMEKQKVNLQIVRQDDCNKMQQDLIQFAGAYKSNGSTDQGTPFVMIMGDGAAAFVTQVNGELSKLGSEYKARIIYSCGRSLGEDKLMGPPAWRENPQNAKGKTVSAYLRDGDWNIAVKWASDNGIPVNPDETTYDPEALNFIAANDFLEACDKYISGYKETRKVVNKGKTTGQTIEVGVDGVATWTPGDVRIAEKKGGLVSIVSTEEYRSQMPNVLIGIDKYMSDNRSTIEGMITAMAQGGDQVKCYSNALAKAGDLSAKVYNEQDGAYWVKYYKGVPDFVDKQGLVVKLGGSRVHNLSDNLALFGLQDGSTNVYGIVYSVFGNIVKDLYPTMYGDIDPIDKVLDLSYLQAVASRTTVKAEGDKVTFNADDNIKTTVSEKNWTIEFETGKATFSPSAEKALEKLYNDLVVASTLKVEIHGHTDNTGDANANMALSEARAFAIKEYLEKRSPSEFPEGRITIRAFGQTEPIASNTTDVGRAKNRRVDIKLGK